MLKKKKKKKKSLTGILNMQLLVAKDDAMVVATSILSESFSFISDEWS